MNKKFNRFKLMLAAAVLIEILLLVVLKIFFEFNVILPIILVVINTMMIYYVLYQYQEDTFYIKRIIGLPGETVQIEDGIIYIDGEILEES